LSLLRQDVQRLEQEIAAFGKAVDAARRQLDEVSERDRLWEKLAEFRWQEVDVPYWQAKTEQYRRDIEQLQQAGGDLAVAKERWEAAKAALQQLQTDKEQQREQLGELKNRLEQADEQRRQAAAQAEQGLHDTLRTQLLERIGALQDAQLDGAAALEARHRERLVKQRDRVNGRKSQATSKAVRIMSGSTAIPRSRWRVFAHASIRNGKISSSASKPSTGCCSGPSSRPAAFCAWASRTIRTSM
jgi:uncharacterized protein YPO0396